MNNLSKRLSVASSLVRKNSRLADIGCDHGYVPAFLMKNGQISFCIASDINIGPLNSCKKLVESLQLKNIDCRLSNGLDSIKPDEIDDILIAGMGGELITSILSKYDWVKDKHLILNPMTHAEIVRKWLYDNGYVINNDLLVRDGGHIYNVFDATYNGEILQKSQADYFLGEIKDFSEKDYFVHLLNYLKNKQKGGSDYSSVIARIEEIL
jgi:tRNA (adenine22-N1)-methyltransferase